MEEKINDFIKRRFNKEDNWLNGNCLWFAYILKKRFPNLNIYYCPIEGHFIVGYLGEFFDWNGKIIPNEIPILLDEIKENDDLWYNKLIRDCLNQPVGVIGNTGDFESLVVGSNPARAANQNLYWFCFIYTVPAKI